MARYRSFLFPEASVESNLLTLDARESHHLVRVFRAKVGETVEVLDGRGTRYWGRIAATDAKAVRIEVDEIVRDAPPMPRVTLLQSIPKGKTMDLILRMATEIGAARVQPVFTHQGDVQIKGERLLSKVEKWRVTMIESCKQCGLGYLPDLAAPISLGDWLRDEPRGEDSLRVVASLEAGSRPLREVLDAAGALQEVVVAVGPEGDFTAEEYAALAEAGFVPVRLGRNVLRAETAAAYILSVVDQCVNASARGL
ncbi:16S rRNA (uracil(1498)-N(3))-methyltransferase [Coraliomargarita sp. SDUM461004]|uniref:Ribosomal RNA small subunit methyltransferase E n=1 Tax=Thalassobacterium sedimentorum TaxID=3041258 RepID=A0ABU1AMF4_9BACT|nr:16S rRNA (uracil(1498)-N(3))-methyltransferase [Coraliomargarita sp. SDUM461004]MDQ8195393.1 16S rRNA (uracil(1498)-N(3))-methyltransferase [Coraliomargarita sp. SDUM461004]